MKLKILLPLATICFAAAAHTGAAQTSSMTQGASATEPAHIPALSRTPLFTPPAAPTQQRKFVLETPREISTLKNPIRSQACLSIRSYNYTADANNPQLSGTTTCTVAKATGTIYATAPATRQP